MQGTDTPLTEIKDHPEPIADSPLRRPIALLSLPNTGTDWFADLLLRQNPALRYYREFFNPICNPKYEDELNKAFGCEMVENYRMLARPYCLCDDVYWRTWAREEYNFTKENYSAFKLDWFSLRFDVFVLYRRAELTFPGERLQVKTWYDAMFASLVKNKWGLERDVRSLVDFACQHADTVNKRQVAAFAIYYFKLLKDAHRYGVPVLDYDQLMLASTEELSCLLRQLPGVRDVEQLAQGVSATRRPSNKNFGELGVDAFFAQLAERAQAYGGEGVQRLAPSHEPTPCAA
jgi:hypothetical protein